MPIMRLPVLCAPTMADVATSATPPASQNKRLAMRSSRDITYGEGG
jgi:hypothetical protein